jgi:hypothetical protein
MHNNKYDSKGVLVNTLKIKYYLGRFFASTVYKPIIFKILFPVTFLHKLDLDVPIEITKSFLISFIVIYIYHFLVVCASLCSNILSMKYLRSYT